MPNIAAAFKEEISRLARRELRAELEKTKASSATHRAEIAALKRRLDAAEKALRRAANGTSKAEQKVRQGDSQNLRFRAAGLAAHRKRLGLSASDFGRLIGVSGQSIYKWEAGETKPRASQLAAIAMVRKMGKEEANSALKTPPRM